MTGKHSDLYAARNTHNDQQCFNMDTSVTAEDLLVHYGGDGQAVEAVGESLPQLDVESAFTCEINKSVSHEASGQGTI